MKITAQVYLDGVIKVNNINDIQEGDRLFQELGNYREYGKILNRDGEIVDSKEFIRSNVYQEIVFVKNFIGEHTKLDFSLPHNNFVRLPETY